MMAVLKSMLSAFLMYSKIPVPQVEWKEENRRYSFCFFPLIGVVIGALLLLWKWLCDKLVIGTVLYACGCVLVPILVTGGIHLDGFCDVSDARASYANRDKLLQIMSDSHVGAFAVIRVVLLLMVQFACFTETRSDELLRLVAVSFVMSRALSGLAAIMFRGAKKEGTLQSFAKPAYRTVTGAVLGVVFMSSVVLILVMDAKIGTFVLIVGAIVFVYYRQFSYKKFGGITGDLAGWFLQVFEVAFLVAVVLADKVLS